MWFDSEKDKCLESLKELFLYRQKTNKDKRIQQNSQTKPLRDVSRIFWVTRIMVYLDLEECMKMDQICVYFNQLIKSPIFIKFMVQINERTKIDISLNTFETQEHKIMQATRKKIQGMMAGGLKSSGGAGGGALGVSSGQGKESVRSHRHREDRDAQIEILVNTKKFLTEQVKKNEEMIKSQQKDIDTLKELVRIDKQTKAKSQQLLSAKEKELEDLRKESLKREQETRARINDLTSSNVEKDKQIEAMVAERKKLKLHKKVLKEEVIRLRKDLDEVEKKAQGKQAALKSLAEFFNN